MDVFSVFLRRLMYKGSDGGEECRAIRQAVRPSGRQGAPDKRCERVAATVEQF